MSFSYRLITAICRAACAAATLVLAGSTCFLTAQTSSSADYHLLADPDASPLLSPGADADPASHTSGQRPVPAYGYRDKVGHIAAVFGGGVTIPASEDQNDLTYGWNVDLGGGYKFNKKFSLLGEFQFDSNKIPAKVLQQVGEPGGNIHIWSLTANPVWNYKTGGDWGGYLTGGGGFYRKTTSFTQPAIITSYYCDYFYCYPYQYQGNVVVSQFATNQGGMDVGGGFTFGNWSGGKFYAEARYNWIATPGRSTKLVPVTLGFRW